MNTSSQPPAGIDPTADLDELHAMAGELRHRIESDLVKLAFIREYIEVIEAAGRKEKPPVSPGVELAAAA